MVKNYRHNNEGVAAVEFALLAPILLTFLLGILDFGLYINTTMQLENTTRSAAQYIALGGDVNDIQANIITQSALSQDVIDNTTVTATYICECSDGVSVDCDNATCGAGDYLRRFVNVNMSTTYQTIFPYPGLPASLDIGGTVRLQVTN